MVPKILHQTHQIIWLICAVMAGLPLLGKRQNFNGLPMGFPPPGFPISMRSGGGNSQGGGEDGQSPPPPGFPFQEFSSNPQAALNIIEKNNYTGKVQLTIFSPWNSCLILFFFLKNLGCRFLYWHQQQQERQRRQSTDIDEGWRKPPL